MPPAAAHGLRIVPEAVLRRGPSPIEYKINHNLAKRQSYALSHMGERVKWLYTGRVRRGDWGWGRLREDVWTGKNACPTGAAKVAGVQGVGHLNSATKGR